MNNYAFSSWLLNHPRWGVEKYTADSRVLRVAQMCEGEYSPEEWADATDAAASAAAEGSGVGRAAAEMAAAAQSPELVADRAADAAFMAYATNAEDNFAAEEAVKELRKDVLDWRKEKVWQ